MAPATISLADADPSSIRTTNAPFSNNPFSNMLIDLHNIAFYLFEVLAKNGIKTPRSLSLNAIADFFDLKREGLEHNALEDALITGECLRECMNYTNILKLKA